MLKGSVVRSLAGRDKDLLLAVTYADERWICVCNGKERPLHNPKRKNAKHVEALEQRLSEDQMRSDKSLRKALAIIKSEMKSRR